MNLDEAYLVLLSLLLASQTDSSYEYTFRRFRFFYEQWQAGQMPCALVIIFKYIRHMLEFDAQFNIVIFHGSKNSKMEFVGYILEFSLVYQAVKAVFGSGLHCPISGNFGMVPISDNFLI